MESAKENNINDINSKNTENLNENKTNEEITLNSSAKDYIPKKKIPQEKLEYNLNAAEYVPSYIKNKDEEQQLQEEEEENEEEDEAEIDKFVDDLAEEEINDQIDDDESDDEKWYPRFKECECCKGFVYKCQGTTCKSMGECYCKMQDDFDEEDN